jgi:repressor LexA
MNSSFGERLKTLREEHKLTQRSLADALNLGYSTIAMYEGEKREPNYENLETIADYFNVDMNYLLGKSDIKNSYLTTSEENVHVSLPSPEPVRDIMIYGDISCGTGLFVDDAVVGHISVPVAMLPSKSADYFAQYASGDSMIDAGINDGDLLIFEKTTAVENGQIGCFCVDNNIALCKKFSRNAGNVFLLPANDKYAPIPVKPENECFRILGKEILKIGK